MDRIKETYPVAIVGGGPVGLFLAIALQQKQIDCIVLERRADRISHSRSLGIHPVSLERLEQIGIVDDFLESGIKIEKGIAFNNKRKIGTVSFETCPKPYTYVLSLPQFKTEELLERNLNKIDPGCLVRSAEVETVNTRPESVEVLYNIRGDKRGKLECKFLVGCDGKNSRIRNEVEFSFRGGSYPDTYIMGDFSDNTVFGTDAAVFLCREGLIESFPLTNYRRRWVVKTDRFIENVTRTMLEKRIAERIGHDIGEEENYMLSSFGVQKFIADPMAEGRIFLAGDAAHVVSPIGGQGMNLGWLDAWDLSFVLKEALTIKNDSGTAERARNYASRRRRVTKTAIRRAELNMALGRKQKVSFHKDALVWLMLNTPLKHLMARMFTMRGLDRWPV